MQISATYQFWNNNKGEKNIFQNLGGGPIAGVTRAIVKSSWEFIKIRFKM